MKILNLLAIIIMVVISCKPVNPDINAEVSSKVNDTIDNSSQNETNKFLIQSSQAGAFAIGNELPGPAMMMTYKMRKEQMTRRAEDGPVTEEVTIISEGNEDLLWLKPKYASGSNEHNNAISEIIIQSPLFKTDKNIGIGSTISEFVAAYPDAKIWWTFVGYMFVLETGALKAQFLLDKNDYKGSRPDVKNEITPINISDFNPDAKIQKIRMI